MSDDDGNVEELRRRYLTLFREDLPAAAKTGEHEWPVRNDHCFMRIVLDQLFGGCWYDHLSRKTPAYRQLDADQLRFAIDAAERFLGGDDETLRLWNADSLRWRGKN